MVTCANFSHYLLRGGPPFPGVVAVLENRALNASIPVIKCLQRSVLLSLHYYAQHTNKYSELLAQTACCNALEIPVSRIVILPVPNQTPTLQALA